jgi:hypothetical protein
MKEVAMGSEASEQMMSLLQELAGLREQDEHDEGNPSNADQEAFQLRQRRREEITGKIKAVAEQKKESEGTETMSSSD